MTTAAYNCECAEVIINIIIILYIIIHILMVTIIILYSCILFLKCSLLQQRLFIVVAIFKNKNVYQCVGATRHPLQFGRT